MTAEDRRAFSGMNAVAALMPAGLIYTLFVPAGLIFHVGTLEFYISRVFLVVMLPFIIAQCIRARLHLRAADYLILATCSWMVISFIVNRGIAEGLESGGRDLLDLLGTWFLVRGCIRSEEDFTRLLKLILPGLMLVAAALFIESVTGSFRILNAFPIPNSDGTSYNEYRLGLLRAFGPFSHAILAGLFMTSFVTLYGLGLRQPTLRWLGMAASLMGFFTLSSAAIANLVLHAGFYGYRVITRVAGYRTEWRPLAIAVIAFVALLQMMSGNGAIAVIINNGALDPQTGYFRLAIWEFGTASVASRPVFGHGYQPYDRPAWMMSDSIDNHWLFIAIRYGLPAVILYLALVLLIVFRLGSISMKLPGDKGNLFSALMIVLCSATLLGLTVAFVAEFHIWFIFMLGASTGLISMYDRRAALARALTSIEVKSHGLGPKTAS